MPHGGVRPGAGRKPKAERYFRQIEAAEKKIADYLPRLVDNMLTLANGVTVMDPGLDGTPGVYQKAPDRQANEYLVNRILGKPTERHEHDIDAEIAGYMAALAASREEEVSG